MNHLENSKNKKKKKSILIDTNNFIILIVCLVLFTSSIFTSFGSVFRYFKYFLFPILYLIILFFNYKIRVNKILLKNLILYVILLTINLVVTIFFRQVSLRFVFEIILITLPLFTVFLIVGIKKINIEKLLNTLFYFYLASYIFYFFKDFLNISKLFSNILLAIRFSVFPTESWLAFPFGLFSLYFIIEKQRVKSLLAIIFFIFAFKRISILALIISILIYLIFYANKKKVFSKLKTVKIFLLLNFIFILTLYFFIDGTFSKIIYKYSGLSVNHFTQGRFKIYNETLSYFKDEIWIGSSLGSTHNFIDRKFENVSFLHSDILKIIIELGIISFIVWMLCFFYYNITSKKSIPIVLYLNILFLTDNVFIYFDTLIVFYLILIKFDNDKHFE